MLANCLRRRREITGDQPAHAVGQAREAEVRQNVEKLPVGEQARHDSRYFGVGVGSDGFEFVHHAL